VIGMATKGVGLENAQGERFQIRDIIHLSRAIPATTANVHVAIFVNGFVA